MHVQITVGKLLQVEALDLRANRAAYHQTGNGYLLLDLHKQEDKTKSFFLRLKGDTPKRELFWAQVQRRREL